MTIREFKMPDVGEGLTEAEILKWYVQPGDTVTDGQVVCEVETAKAAVELPIPFDGTVHELLFPEGTTVDVGQVIISVNVGGGAEPEAPAAPAAPPPRPGAGGRAGGRARAGGPSAGPRRLRRGRELHQAPGPQDDGRRARRGGRARAAQRPRPGRRAPAGQAAGAQARQGPRRRPGLGHPDRPGRDHHPRGRPPRGGPGPGAGGRGPGPVAAPAPAAAPAQAAPVVPSDARETRIPIKGVRKATAAAMVGSAFTAPHVTEFVTFDITRTMKLVEELKSDKDMAGLRVNPLLLIAKAVLVAAKRNPDINAAWDEANQEIVLKHYVNLGIAAATPRGLIVPNIKDAHAQTLPELSKSLSELVATAREGRTTPAAMQGGTFTITNVGVFGVDTGTPILNPGESAILAVGAIKLQPWVHKGKVKPRQVTTLALSFDHRLVDGELGSKFLADVAAILENPKRLITWA
ncbi:dihydrolipoamide acetyltransferase family protein [Streptomyces diastatochromogenes]|nr:dihydrolipoamide acetyltransferase family protein [Streptomyces diastatochromogenes]